MKKILLLGTAQLLFIGLFVLSFCSSPNENYLQVAKEATTPNFNFLFAKNASLLGRIGMTLTGKKHKTCINTVTSFFNEYHTCSNCEDFVENLCLSCVNPQVNQKLNQKRNQGQKSVD